MFTIDQFTFDSARNILVAEASDLFGHNQATREIEIRGRSRVERFVATEARRDAEGELVANVYWPVDAVRNSVRVHVIND
jgi:hypothetical protein